MSHFIVADNQELTRLGFETCIRRDTASTLARAANRRQLIEELRRCGESVVVLDYTLFDFPAPETLLIVASRFPGSVWLLASDELTVSFIKQAVYQAENIGIIFKDAHIDEIHSALFSAQMGKRYVCRRASEMLKAEESRPSPAKLTPTEVEILRLMAQGKTTKEIAAERSLSAYTVNTHRKNIFRKLAVNTAHEAVKYAFRAGLVDTSEFYI